MFFGKPLSWSKLSRKSENSWHFYIYPHTKWYFQRKHMSAKWYSFVDISNLGDKKVTCLFSLRKPSIIPICIFLKVYFSSITFKIHLKFSPKWHTAWIAPFFKLNINCTYRFPEHNFYLKSNDSEAIQFNFKAFHKSDFLIP